ncbi:MAG: response regulator transcription factor [Vicinamibacterales bacterium]
MLRPTTVKAPPATPSIRIVIAGEHPIFRHGLRRLIEAEPDFTIVAETGDGAVASAIVRDTNPDILLLGFATSGASAAETVKVIAESGSATKTVLLTDRVDTPEVMRVVQHGAKGIVPKDSSPELLFESIRTVMAGHFWLDKKEADAVPALRKLEAERRRAKAFGLTRREIEILRAVVAGYTNKEIAERSSLSENTVKSHLTHIFNKSGASNRVELALFAAHHRLLDGV